MRDDPELSPPFLQIVRGEPSVEEIAALVAVLSAGSGARKATAPAPVFGWSARSSLMRTSLSAGHGGWRASTLGR
ncbi:MAG: acyl-CoA carboxylase subunit epsilon [Geodermatophilaceae bacterium]